MLFKVARVMSRSRMAAIQPIQALRMASSQVERTPEVVATSILDSLPGATMASKASTFMVGASVAAFLVSKEIYLIDGEFFEMGCIFGAYYVWYTAGKDGAAKYFEGRKNQIKSVLDQARLDHKAVVQERMDHIGKLSDVVNTTEALFGVSKDIVKLEAEAFELQQKATFTREVKSVLDNWVRQEAAAREAEQAKLVAHVIDNVKEKLADPKMQASLLLQSIADLEKIRLHK